MKGRTHAKTHEESIARVEASRRGDIQRLHDLVREGAPELESTIDLGTLGYGRHAYRYANGREGEWMKIGIANSTRYVSLCCCAADDRGYVAERFRDRLPKANVGPSCVRFTRLADLDEEVRAHAGNATFLGDAFVIRCVGGCHGAMGVSPARASRPCGRSPLAVQPSVRCYGHDD